MSLRPGKSKSSIKAPTTATCSTAKAIEREKTPDILYQLFRDDYRTQLSRSIITIIKDWRAYFCQKKYRPEIDSHGDIEVNKKFDSHSKVRKAENTLLYAYGTFKL